MNFECYLNICRENSSFIKTRQALRVRDQYTFIIISRWFHLWIGKFLDKVLEKIKTHILCLITVSRTSCLLWDHAENYDIARQATNVNIIGRMRSSCWLTRTTNTLRIWDTYCFCTATRVARKRFSFFTCVSCSFHVVKIVTLYPSILFLFCRFYSLPFYPSTSTLNVLLSVPSYYHCLQTYVIRMSLFFSEYLSLNTFSVIFGSSPISPISIGLEFDPSVSSSLHSISSFLLLQKLQL